MGSSDMNRDRELVRSVWPEWELTEQLGAGQYGIVYKARKQGFAGDSFAAVKVVTIENESRESGFSPEQTDAYLASVARNYAREIRMMESVKGYSNIVNIEDYSVISSSGGKPWLVLIRMELLTPLYEYLENREITEGEIVRIGTDLCRALEVCAAKKIVHRDIKPANVFVNTDGVFKLGDFGVARQILSYTSQTRTGSPDFMAPEMYNGSRPAADFEQAQSEDIYSLGMLLYWIANGRRMPFVKQAGLITADELTDAFTRKMSGEPLPAPLNASGALGSVILKACAYDPDDRYPTAGQLREALEGIGREKEQEEETKEKPVPGTGGSAGTDTGRETHGNSGTGGGPRRPPRGRNILIALLVLALAAGGAWYLWGRDGTDGTEQTGEQTAEEETIIGMPVEEKPETPEEETSEEETEAPAEETAEETTEAPADTPTPKPTKKPTKKPTEEPTETPTEKPTKKPTEKPTKKPTKKPTEKPTDTPEPVQWPVMDLSGTETRLSGLADGDRHQAFFGPDRKKYSGAGAYQPKKLSSAKALFQEGNYVLVDMYYPSVGKRCVYFMAYSVTKKPSKTVSLTAYPTELTENTQPRLGPGGEYEDGDVEKLKKGTTVGVLLEYQGWIFAEFDCSLGKIRAWLPADSVR